MVVINRVGGDDIQCDESGYPFVHDSLHYQQYHPNTKKDAGHYKSLHSWLMHPGVYSFISFLRNFF